MTGKSISQYTVLLAMIGHHNVLSPVAEIDESRKGHDNDFSKPLKSSKNDHKSEAKRDHKNNRKKDHKKKAKKEHKKLRLRH